MKIALRFGILLSLITATALPAWQQDSPPSHVATAGYPWSELMRSMDKMHATIAAAQPSGDADLDFVNLMLPHHQAAIDMARTQLMYGKDPQMRRLAQEIVTDQQSEIELMQLWLKQRALNPAKADHTLTPSLSKEH
jgi:uncharacterized protein (DUF305 family)